MAHDTIEDPVLGWNELPDEPGSYAWWDGRTFTTKAVRSGDTWEYVPEEASPGEASTAGTRTPSPAPEVTSTAPTPPPRRRRRRWPWIVAASVVAIAVLGAGLAVIDRTVLTHDLMHADFSVDAKPFVTGNFGDYTATLIDGRYQIDSRTVPASPATSFAWFARTAYNVDLSADVVAVNANGGRATVGISCLDEPKKNGHGYVFVVDPSGYALGRSDTPSGTTLATVPAHHPWSGTAERVRLTCAPAGLTSKTVDVRGYINGKEVIHAHDSSGFDTYKAAALIFYPSKSHATVQFDNVSAIVPSR